MQNSPIYLSAAVFAVIVLIVHYVLSRTGKIPGSIRLNDRDYILSAGIVVAVVFGAATMTVNAVQSERDKVAKIFGLDAGIEPMVFETRKRGKDNPFRFVEAIYNLSPEDFEAVRAQTPDLSGGVSFRYTERSFNRRKVQSYTVSGGALAWKPLPRINPGPGLYFPERSAASRTHTPDDREMSGQSMCAFIEVPMFEEGVPPPDSHQIVPCDRVIDQDGQTVNGIVILGHLNERDRTLHVDIGWHTRYRDLF